MKLTTEKRIIERLDFKDIKKIQVPFVTYDTNNTAEVLLPRISMIIKNVKRNLNTDEIEIY